MRNHLTSVDERIARLPSEKSVEGARLRTNDLRASLTAVTLEAENVRTAWVRDAQDARTKRQGLADQYQDLKEQRQRLVKAGPEGDCPTCARPLGAEYENVLGLLDRQIEEVVCNGNFYKQRIEQLQNEPAELDELDRQRAQGGAGALRRDRRARPARGPGAGGRSAGPGADPAARAGHGAGGRSRRGAGAL